MAKWQRYILSAVLGALAWAVTLSQPNEVVYAAYYPASAGCSSQITVNQTASTDLKTFTNNGYICYILLVSATAQNVSLVQGAGTTCATSPTALIGATTADATHGVPLAANGGWSGTVPAGSYIKTTATAQHLCLLQSGTGLIAGVISYLDAS